MCGKTGAFSVAIIGTLGAPFGVKGWLKVHSSTVKSHSIVDYQPWLVQQQNRWQVVELLQWKKHYQHLVVQLKNIDTFELAKCFVNQDIACNADLFPSLPLGEYYWKDLIGCWVETPLGIKLGRVITLMETGGAHDLLVVKPLTTYAHAAREHLIPFVEQQIIKRVDLTISTIIVDWDPNF